jgi:hypothetical protein
VCTGGAGLAFALGIFAAGFLGGCAWLGTTGSTFSRAGSEAESGNGGEEGKDTDHMD